MWRARVGRPGVLLEWRASNLALRWQRRALRDQVRLVTSLIQAEWRHVASSPIRIHLRDSTVQAQAPLICDPALERAHRFELARSDHAGDHPAVVFSCSVPQVGLIS